MKTAQLYKELASEATVGLVCMAICWLCYAWAPSAAVRAEWGQAVTDRHRSCLPALELRRFGESVILCNGPVLSAVCTAVGEDSHTWTHPVQQQPV
jgi:hypothetical protein